MALHPILAEIIAQTEAAHLPPLSDQSIEQVRKNFALLTRWQGDRAPLPKVESHVIKGSSGDLPLRIFYPEVDKKLPVCLYFHGGSYVKGDLETHDPICRHLAKNSGVVIVALQYRLAPESTFPAPIEDALTLISWIEQQQKQLQIDPSQLCVAGDSAGGNLAALLTHKLKNRFKLQALIYPQLDFSFSLESHKKFAKGFLLEEESLVWARSLYVPKGIDYQDPELSPLFASDFGGLPPTFLLTAEYDPLRDEGELYAKKLIEAGVPVTSHRFESMTHGFVGLSLLLEPAEQALLDVAKAIREAV
ncbi:MAG: alpha/beta hydrolase [Candidatus Algichlamydia australiensis]|nr:alpha/beta hydrolase [Chlamydiales bacterium]